MAEFMHDRPSILGTCRSEARACAQIGSRASPPGYAKLTRSANRSVRDATEAPPQASAGPYVS